MTSQNIEHKLKTYKPLLWVAMLSIIMIFAGLMSGYIVRKGGGNWKVFELPNTLLISTICVVLSSALLLKVNNLVKQDKNQKLASVLFALTILLGVAFAYFQLNTFEVLLTKGVYFTGAGSTASGSFLYVIILAHLAHVIGGFMSLIWIFISFLNKKYNSQDMIGLETGSIFWHFLGALWLFLYLFLLFNN